MAVDVRQPQKEDTMGKVLKVASIIPGVGQAANIVSVGRDLMADNPQSPMERRYNSMAQPPPVEDPMKALEDARVALAGQPPEVQQQYLPAIQAAQLKARRDSGGMA